MRKVFAVAGFALALAACQPRVDTSSPQAYAASIQSITKDMTPEQQQEFQSALIAIAFNTSDPSQGFMRDTNPSAPIFLGSADRIAGKTANEIVRLGYETRIGILDREIAEIMAAIQRQRAERESHRAVFDNIHLDGARYHVTNNFGILQPTISFSITNNSNIAVKRIFVHGILTSPGRSIPWVSEDFNYEFSGGLEPGESEHLDLEPNMFGEWRADPRYSNRSDLNLALSLANIEGPDGQQLIQGEPGDVEAKQAELATKQRLRTELQNRLGRS